MRIKFIFFLGSVLFCVFILAMIWEFTLEPLVSGWIPTDHESETINDKWKFIFTAIAFSGLALIFPTLVALRNLNKKEKAEKALMISNTNQFKLRELNKKFQSIREEEKLKLAREIHDELGQVITFCKLDLQWIKNRIKFPEEKIAIKFNDILHHFDDSLNRIRRISSELRPDIIDVMGISEAVKWQAKKFFDKTQIEYEITILPERIEMKGDLSLDMFRVFQETLTNITRHAEATLVQITLVEKEKVFMLEVRDDGIGFDTTGLPHSMSLGILGMTERSRNWGGRLEIHSTPGVGTTITAVFPKNDIHDCISTLFNQTNKGPFELES